MADNPIIDSAQFGKLTINRRKNGSIEVLGGNFKSTAAALREIAANASIVINEGWNTRYLGWFVIQQLKSQLGNVNNSDPTPELFIKYQDLGLTIQEPAHLLRNIAAANDIPAWQLLFDSIKRVGNELLSVKKDGKIGFASAEGEILIEPIFDAIGNGFADGMIVTQIHNSDGEPLYGYVNDSGHEEFAPIFSYASDFKDGYANVIHKGVPYTIDKSGEEIQNIEIEIDDVAAIVSAVFEVCKADGVVTKSDSDYSWGLVTELGVVDQISQLQVLQKAKMMSASEIVGRLSSMNFTLKKDIASRLYKATYLNGKSQKRIDLYKLISKECDILVAIN